jgi:hypothetical protein
VYTEALQVFTEQVRHEDIGGGGGGGESKAPIILNLDNDSVSNQVYATADSSIAKHSLLPYEQKDGWSSETFWKFMGRKKLLTVTAGHATECSISARI